MSAKALLLYAAAFSGFLGALLVARTALTVQKGGKAAGFAWLSLMGVTALASLAPGLPESPSLSWVTMLLALVCGSSLGFGVLRHREALIPAAPTPPTRPMTASATPDGGIAAEMPWAIRLTGVIFLVSGLSFCLDLGQGTSPLLSGALALFFLGFAVALLPGARRVKGLWIGSLALVVMGAGRVLPAGAW